MAGEAQPANSEALTIVVDRSALLQTPHDLRRADSSGDSRWGDFSSRKGYHAISPGPAEPLIRRLLAANLSFSSAAPPVEVVVVARSCPAAEQDLRDELAELGLPPGARIGVGAERCVLGDALSGWAVAQGASLFLSADADDVRAALLRGIPAACTYPTAFRDEPGDSELRIAFDFDGVLADDAAERVFQEDGLEAFEQNELARKGEPLGAGPLATFCRSVSGLKRALTHAGADGASHTSSIRTAIVTSRGAPADARVATTLRSLGVSVDEAFFLSGLPKAPMLTAFKPHIFFDDQWQHLEPTLDTAPCAHVPFGVANRVDGRWAMLDHAPRTMNADAVLVGCAR